MNAESLNFLLALGTIGMQIGSVALFALFFLREKLPGFESVRTFLRTWGLWIGLALTLGGSLLTLYYSEVLGFPPCPLCWWQRVFLYPQVVLFALAVWKYSRGEALRAIVDSSLALSVAGLGVALYHHALQVLPHGSLPCPAEGTVSCAQRFVFEFNYITFPLMAASLFAFLIAIMLFVRNARD